MRNIGRSIFVVASVLACSTPNTKQAKTEVGQKITPSELRLSASSSNPAQLWKLFDRSTSEGWLPTEDALSVTADFSEEKTISALKVFGPSGYRVTLSTEEGVILDTFDLSLLSQGWNQLALSSPISRSSVQLQFEPLGELSSISELEFWGTTSPSSEDFPGSGDGPGERFLTAASQEEMVLQTESLGGGCAEVEFTLSQSPAAYREAFLSFESWGLLRPSALDFSWNGTSTQEGVWLNAGRSDVAKRFTIQLDPEKLQFGKNEMRACLPSEADGEVILSNPVVVGVAELGNEFVSRVLVDGKEVIATQTLDALLDENLSTKRLIKKEALLKLERLTSPQQLSLEVVGQGAPLSSVGCWQLGTWQSLSPSAELSAGKNLVPLSGGRYACEQIKLVFAGPITLAEVSLVGSGGKERVDVPSFVVTSSELFNDEAVLQGFARLPATAKGPILLKLDQRSLSSLTGRFSEKLQRPEDSGSPWMAELSAVLPNKTKLSQLVTFIDATEDLIDAVANQDFDKFQTGRNTLFGDPGEAIEREVSDLLPTNIYLGERVGIEVPPGAMKHNRVARSNNGNGNGGGNGNQTIKIKHLKKKDMPPLDPLLINVTPGQDGFEYTPHGATFDPAVEITLPYDPTLLPEGNTYEDVKTYFYNEQKGQWEEVERVSVDVGLQTVKSRTTHFSTYMNGVLASPENPSVSSYTPTEMSSLAAADPGSGIDMIQPPSANNSGSANVSYPLWVPSGRGAYSPSLALSYSSEGGNSWVGQGWDLQLSSIQIDTRYGVPTYADDEEPRYLFDGDPLIPAAKEDNGPKCAPNLDIPSRRYRPRVEGAFSYILRCKSLPSDHINGPDGEAYYWVVYDRNGTKYTFGDTPTTRLTSYRPVRSNPDRIGIFSWHLREVEDVDGNSTTFAYFEDKEPSGFGGEPWRQLYPASIVYTSHAGIAPKYRIDFILDGEQRKDTPVMANQGFKTLTRYLLRAVRVSFDGVMFRQYLLTYAPSETYEKTLLQTIEVHGPEGRDADCFSTDSFEKMTSCTHGDPYFFYEHTFEYNDEQVGFADPEEWKVDGSPVQDASALTESNGFSADANLFVGIGLTRGKSPSAGVDVGGGLGVRKELAGFFDINGDGLPDEVYRTAGGIEVLYNQFVPPATPTPNGQLGCNPTSPHCKFLVDAPQGDLIDENCEGEDCSLFVDGITKLGLDLNRSGSIGASINGMVGGAGLNLGASFGGSISKSSRFMDDLNGDGLIDLITKDEAFIAQRHTQDPLCPENTICYRRFDYGAPGAAQVTIDDIDEALDNRQSHLRAVRKWVAPFGGRIRVYATATRVRSGIDEDIEAGLFFYRPATNQNPDAPNSILKNICADNCADRLSPEEEGDAHTLSDGFSPLEVQDGDFKVEPGDEIYLLIGSALDPEYQGGRPLGEAETELVITYENACLEDLNGEVFCRTLGPDDYQKKEPTGSSVFIFDSAHDFRLAGRPPVPFAAPATGSATFKSNLSGLQNSDNVRICIQRFSAGDELDLNFPCDPNLPFDSNEPFPVGYDLLYLYQSTTAQADAFVLPTEEINALLLAGDQIVLRVESDFPIDPERITWDVELQYNEICHPTNSTTCVPLCEEGAPGCDNPAQAQLQQSLHFTPDKFEPHFPQLKLARVEPRDVYYAPANGHVIISGIVRANTGFPFSQAIFGVRSENELIYKENVFANTTFELEPYEVTEGQSLSFDVLVPSEFDADTVIRFIPGVADTNSPEEIIGAPSHTYLPPERMSDDPARLVRGEYATPFQGGYHGWFYGAWKVTETQPFDPDELMLLAPLNEGISEELLAAAALGQIPPNITPQELLLYITLRRLIDTYFPMVPKHTGFPTTVDPLTGDASTWYGPDASTFVTKYRMHGGRIGDQIQLDNIDDPQLTEDLEAGDSISPDSFENINGALRVSSSNSLTFNGGISFISGFQGGTQAGTGSSQSMIKPVDVDGDGILDIVTPSYWIKGALNANIPLEFVLNDFPAGIGKGQSFNFGFSSNAELLGSIINKLTSARRMHKAENSKRLGSGLDIDKGMTVNRSITTQELMDINGDGLPDILERLKGSVRVRYNLGGAFGAPENLSAYSWTVNNSSDPNADSVDEFAAGNQSETQDDSEVLQHDTTVTTKYSTGFEFPLGIAQGNLGVSFNSSTTRTVTSTADLNGDGLLDLVFKKHNEPMFVQFNRGSSFTEPFEWIPASSDWGSVLADAIIPTDILFAGAFPGALDSVTALLAGPDVIAGTGFYSSIQPLGLSVSFSALFAIPLPYPFVLLEPGATVGIERDTYELVLSDIDGDGAPDHVLRRAGFDFESGGQMFVKHNKVTGRENLLKTIHNPLGGTISLQYQRTPNTVNQPQSKMVLSSVVVDDGHEFNPIQGDVYDSPSIVANFSYEDGFFDRNEKEFFGFKTVASERPDGITEVQTFENRSYSQKGLLLSTKRLDSNGATLESSDVEYASETLFDANNPTFDPQGSGELCLNSRHPLLGENACDVVFVRMLQTTSESTEGSFTKKHISRDILYDEVGNLRVSIDEADDATTADDVRSEVVFYINDKTRWILGRPSEIRISAASNPTTILRRRSATYTNNGHLQTLTTYIDSTTNDSPSNLATTTFDYDTVGNLIQVLLPANESFTPREGDTCAAIASGNQHVEYTYDTETRQFITKVEDGFDLFSMAEYDKRYGLVTFSEDSNRQVTERRYDNFGRLSKVFSPYDGITAPSMGVPSTGIPSIEMQYFEFGPGQQASAITLHQFSKAPAYPQQTFIQQGGNATIRTVTIVDGVGRAIQVRKTAQIVENGSVQFGMLAQKPPKYDNIGRVMQSYQPFFTTNIGPVLVAPPAPVTSGTQNETTVFTYDAKDRVTQVKHPDNKTVKTAFSLVTGFGGRQLETKVTDENNRIRKSITDGIGRTLAVIEPDLNGPGSGAVTSYIYAVTGEATDITDDEGNRTTLEYDKRGLWTQMDNPDTGKIVQRYDKNGNLILRQEPNHRAIDDAIEYHYDKNRLLCVDYPSKQDVVYTYGGAGLAQSGNTTLGRAGRLLSVQDETGTQSFLYGALGEVKQASRDINEAMFASSQEPLQLQVMKMEYDNFGRMLSMRYPDGEHLRYFYNPAGDLNAVRSDAIPTQGYAPPQINYINEINYDKFGNQVAIIHGNGVKTTRTFDNKRVRLSRATTARANASGVPGAGQKLSDLSYIYDGVGNPTSMASNMPALPNTTTILAGPGSWTFTYDAADRLDTVSACQATSNNTSTKYTQNFDYDSIHNIRVKLRTHQLRNGTNCTGTITQTPPQNNFENGYEYNPNKPHQVSAVGGQSFFYDDSGNLVQKGANLYAWDDANRMVLAQSEQGYELQNFYDAGGTRVFKSSERFGTTLFVSQYFDIRITEREGEPVTAASKHIFAGSTRLASNSISFNPVTNGNSTQAGTRGTTLIFHQDHLGSSSMLTAADGAPREYLQYFADGDVWIDKNTNTPIDGYLFSGKVFDQETGLYDFGARFYDPKSSLWLGIDPAFSETPGSSMGRPMVLSAYAYASWNSIARIDPDGRQDQPASQPTSTQTQPASTPTVIVPKTGKFDYLQKEIVKGYIYRVWQKTRSKQLEHGFSIFGNKESPFIPELKEGTTSDVPLEIKLSGDFAFATVHGHPDNINYPSTDDKENFKTVEHNFIVTDFGLYLYDPSGKITEIIVGNDWITYKKQGAEISQKWVQKNSQLTKQKKVDENIKKQAKKQEKQREREIKKQNRRNNVVDFLKNKEER